jgi:outer membrane protein assembly factor BamA
VKTNTLILFLFGVVSSSYAAQFSVFHEESYECSDGTPIASIELKGLEYTKDHVVLRELVHKVGESFSQKIFEVEKLKLQDLDLFTDISVTCEPAKESINDIFAGTATPAHSLNATKLVYHFKEIFRWIPSPTTKTSDRDGFMIGLALANLNVLGEDIRAELQYRTAVSPIFEKNEYAVYVSSPYFMELPVGWSFEFLRTNSWDDIRRFRDASWIFSLDVKWNLIPHFSLLGHTAYRYLEDGPGHLPEFGLGVAVDFRNSEIDTRKGVYFESSVMHMGFREMNDEHYTEFLEDGRAYYSFGPFVTGASALVRLRPGTVKRYDYFYHGGENSFRGHYADSLYLGIHEALLTLEERFVLLERRPASLCGVNFFYGLQLVAGFDGSLLWDEGAPKWKNYEGAVYGGIHLVLPAIDRIRFEVGYSPDYGEPKFYFGFFDKPSTSRWRNR